MNIHGFSRCIPILPQILAGTEAPTIQRNTCPDRVCLMTYIFCRRFINVQISWVFQRKFWTLNQFKRWCCCSGDAEHGWNPRKITTSMWLNEFVTRGQWGSSAKYMLNLLSTANCSTGHLVAVFRSLCRNFDGNNGCVTPVSIESHGNRNNIFQETKWVSTNQCINVTNKRQTIF